MPIIRRAKPEDAKGIHEAHMRSIRDVCSKDHSTEEIEAWGGRPYREDQRIHVITNHLVWVIEDDGRIEGYGHLVPSENEGVKVGRLSGLYLTPKVSGQGLGTKMVQLMFKEAENLKLRSIFLESTITAHDFYKRMGFQDVGPQTKIEIAGVGIRCFPMKLDLPHNLKSDHL